MSQRRGGLFDHHGFIGWDEGQPDAARLGEHCELWSWARLMPDRNFTELARGYIGGQRNRDYIARTGDWLGNGSIYRTYGRHMGTMNFNHWADRQQTAGWRPPAAGPPESSHPSAPIRVLDDCCIRLAADAGGGLACRVCVRRFWMTRQVQRGASHRPVLRLAGIALAGAVLAAAEIQMIRPPEGTPRDPAQIIRLSDAEFRVLAGGEPGETHFSLPVARVELLCRNPGPGPRAVTLHLDLSGLGTRTNAQGSAWAAMPSRDYLFLQRPGADWVPLRGQVDGWVCSATFAIPPGDTKVGLSPWYTWEDFEAWLRSLADHPHLRRASVGRSDGGRDHWELTITDPASPEAGKRRVFWHAREHAFETFSSFAMEGLIEFLLSPDAAEARRGFVFTLHPMSNPDGVAEGAEYRGGYELRGLRSTASGRLALATVDRVRPHFVITWHNWIAPRDVDTLFYTDAEGDRPSRRASGQAGVVQNRRGSGRSWRTGPRYFRCCNAVGRPPVGQPGCRPPSARAAHPQASALHLAVALGVPCLAFFRDYEGSWNGRRQGRGIGFSSGAAPAISTATSNQFPRAVSPAPPGVWRRFRLPKRSQPSDLC